MNVVEYTDLLERALLELTVPYDLKNEKALEEGHIVPIAKRVAEGAPGVSIFIHPFGNREVCKENCEEARAGKGYRVVGCPRCWKWTKSWATVSAFGMRHTFDVVGRDAEGGTLAIEIKWIHFNGGRAPNGEFQRFLGQCAIASARHSVVLGICGLRGARGKFDEHRAAILEKIRGLGIRLAVLQTSDELEGLEETATL
jgi:hypothetical protein